MIYSRIKRVERDIIKYHNTKDLHRRLLYIQDRLMDNVKEHEQMEANVIIIVSILRERSKNAD